jgi:2'-5' RNA ligase
MGDAEHAVTQPAAPESVRLFFALWPDDSVRAALAGWSREINRRAEGRMMRPETLHITLAFLGATETARLDDVKRAAASVRLREFTLVIDEAGYWRHNQIAWAGAKVVPPQLEALVADLRAALVERGVRFDAKPFVAHATLVRKARPGFRLPRLSAIEWPVREFALIRSELTPEGSRYAVEASWSARAGDACG